MLQEFLAQGRCRPAIGVPTRLLHETNGLRRLLGQTRYQRHLLCGDVERAAGPRRRPEQQEQDEGHERHDRDDRQDEQNRDLDAQRIHAGPSSESTLAASW